jgi:anti-sigma-K factor RskA
MKAYTQDELRELLPAYALGAVSEDEAAAIVAALDGDRADSEQLRAELRSYQELVVQMAQANRVEPPPGVKERLLARVSREKQVALPAREGTGAGGAGGSGRRIAYAVGLAASIALAIGLGGYSLGLRDSVAERDATIRTLTEAQAQLRTELARRERTINTILEAQAQLRFASLAGADAQAGPGIQFFWNERQNVGVVHAFRLPPAASGRAYQVWLIQDGKPVSVAVFNSDSDGHALVEDLTLPSSSRGASLVAVTDEPAGGSPAPTTTPFLAGPLTATR